MFPNLLACWFIPSAKISIAASALFSVAVQQVSKWNSGMVSQVTSAERCIQLNDFEGMVTRGAVRVVCAHNSQSWNTVVA